MPRPGAFRPTVWILSVVLVFTLVWAGYLLVQNSIWKLEATRYAESSGQLEAQAAFRKGFLWLYKIDGQCDEDRFSGKKEGPFEIWIKFYQPALGPAHRDTTERWVESFNEQMRRMQKEPEKFEKRVDPTK
jgi:hypothetical protein